jgi:lipopolysaccharide O-acetyltransferase
VIRDYVRQPMKRVVLRSRAMAPYNRRRFHHFGDGAILHKPAWVYGPHRTSIGAHSLILQGTWLSVESQAWDKPEPALTIGKRVGIRPYCMISCAEQIDIEDDVIIAAFSSVIDSDHTYALGRPNVMHNPLATSPIHIGRGTWIAERVAVLRGANIGRCCIIGANSVVKGEIPDYSIAVGAPARVVGQVEGVDADLPSPVERLF